MKRNHPFLNSIASKISSYIEIHEPFATSGRFKVIVINRLEFEKNKHIHLLSLFNLKALFYLKKHIFLFLFTQNKNR